MANTTAYGFIGLQDLYNQRVASVGIGRVWEAVQLSAQEYSRVMANMASEFVEPATNAQEQIELPGDGTLQPLDEWGNPLPVLPSGSYQVAYPIQGAGTAWGTNRISAKLMTVEEANRNTVDAFRRDADWMIRHIMAAIFDNTTWTFQDKVGANGGKGLGAITIQPLANGDSVTYVKKGASAPATDTHYLAQAAAIADATNPYPTIYTELMEHPSNSGPIKCYIPTALVATTQALTNFIPVSDPDITLGGLNAQLSSSIDVGFGDQVLGKVDRCWVIEWGRMPSDIILAHASGTPVLGMREYPTPELQGFFPEQHSPDGNTVLHRFLRYAGFGVRNRLAAVVYRVGNGSYAIPTGYSTPLPV
jgi:hypothetical protein